MEHEEPEKSVEVERLINEITALVQSEILNDDEKKAFLYRALEIVAVNKG